MFLEAGQYLIASSSGISAGSKESTRSGSSFIFLRTSGVMADLRHIARFSTLRKVDSSSKT